VRNGESKWSHRAQTDLVKPLVFTFTTKLLARSASHRSNRCIVTAPESSSDRMKDGVCVKVSHGQLLSTRVGQANDATYYISTLDRQDLKRRLHTHFIDSLIGSAEWVPQQHNAHSSWTPVWSSHSRLRLCDMFQRY
jgi:hypothetical protein